MATIINIESIVLQRRDTAANWTANNPILRAGQKGVETDTLEEKLGDGVTDWNTLAYLPSGGVAPLPNYTEQTGNYTTLATDDTINCTSGTFNVTLITAVGRAGKKFDIVNSGTGLITMLTTSGQNINGFASGALVLEQGTTLTVQSTGAHYIILGNIPA